MSPLLQLQAFANSIYLTYKGRYFGDLNTVDGITFVKKMVDHANMLVDELENEVGPDGQMVDWWFSRENLLELATGLTQGDASVDMLTTVQRLITDEGRYVQIKQDSSIISNWKVVHPKDITNKNDRVIEDMCAQVGSKIVFSRAFRDTEASGTVVGDVILKLPRITYNEANGVLNPTNIKLLTTVQPKQLLITGVAKNATLPDIVQGKLSPSYVQKFNDLLQGAITRSNATSQSARAERDSFGYVRGV